MKDVFQKLLTVLLKNGNNEKKEQTLKLKSVPFKFRLYYFPLCLIAAVTAFFISVAIVMGPTPPGTGVM